MCDYDPPSVYVLRFRTARKAHACSECRAGVAAGANYAEHRGVWDGHGATVRQCLRCYRVCVALERDGVECLSFGEMRMALRERMNDRRGFRVPKGR